MLRIFYALTVLPLILLVFINIDKFESFKLSGLAGKLKASIAEAGVTKAEFEFKRRVQAEVH